MVTEEPIVSRLDRLDIMLKHLEEMKGCSNNRSLSTPRSSYASTPSSGVLTTSDGGMSSVNSSPKSLEKYCRPIDAVVMETETKGNVIDRLVQAENRLLKLCKQLEEEREAKRVEIIMMMKKKEEEDDEIEIREVREEEVVDKKEHKKKKKKGLKQLVKSCVGGKSKLSKSIK